MNDRLSASLTHSKIRLLNRQGRRGFVYIIGCHQYVKVGFAENAEARLLSFQVGNPYELKLLAKFPSNNMVEDEGRLHALWKRYEVRGEWFDVPAGELAFVLTASKFEEIFK